MLDKSPTGLLLTWTTYGTWVQGDARGSYDRKGKTEREHNVAPNPRFEALRRRQLKFPPLTLDAAMRKVVRLSIEQCCAYRGWGLLAVNVRTNHVHVALPNCAAGEEIVHEFKAYATRRLREAKLVAPKRSVWTSGGSVSRLYGPEEVADAIDYVKNRQGQPLPEA